MSGVETKRTYCRVCMTQCGLLADVAGEQILRIRGDREHPITRGYTCPKGRATDRIHHHPDAITRPLMRKHGELVPVGWDEAIAQFKQALLLEPRSQDAKWNLELLTQRTPPPQPRPQPQSQQQQQQPAGGISPNQAEAILSSVEQNESATRQNVVRRQRLRSSASTKDW